MAEEVKEEVKASKKAQPTSFKLKDGSVREFSKEVHGADFAKVAAEFAETNASKLA